MLHQKKKSTWYLNVGNARLNKVNKLFPAFFLVFNMLKCMPNFQKIRYLMMESFHRISSFKKFFSIEKMLKMYLQSWPNTGIKKSNQQYHRGKSIENHCNTLQRLIKQLCISHNKNTTRAIIDLYIKYYSLFVLTENDVTESSYFILCQLTLGGQDSVEIFHPQLGFIQMWNVDPIKPSQSCS